MDPPDEPPHRAQSNWPVNKMNLLREMAPSLLDSSMENKERMDSPTMP
jgi:hypothetical protein